MNDFGSHGCNTGCASSHAWNQTKAREWQQLRNICPAISRFVNALTIFITGAGQKSIHDPSCFSFSCVLRCHFRFSSHMDEAPLSDFTLLISKCTMENETEGNCLGLLHTGSIKRSCSINTGDTETYMICMSSHFENCCHELCTSTLSCLFHGSYQNNSICCHERLI